MSAEELKIDNDFILFRLQNETSEIQRFEKSVSLGLIQFHFILKGQGKFIFNQGQYALDVLEEKSLLLYNPQKELPLNLEIGKDSWIISVFLSIKKLHQLVSEDADHIPFLSLENTDKKYYTEEDISPSIAIVLNQIFHYKNNSSIKNLYIKGKSYELMSLYFNKNEGTTIDNCPFLSDETNLKKIKQAKEYLLKNMIEPPSLQALADVVGLPLKKLKSGFKTLYDNSVYGYLIDHKLELSRKLLDSNQYNINEVSLEIGYSTPSHFIAAFKKKYGITPKKYMDR
jgi:AraC-like DNA-binding protein